jgi:hypothetical protein
MEEHTVPSATAEPAGTAEPARPDGGRRPDVVALVGGVVFVAVSVIGLTDRLQLSVGHLRWLGPALLVAFGILLVATAGGARERGRPDDVGGPDVVGRGAEHGASGDGRSSGIAEDGTSGPEGS